MPPKKKKGGKKAGKGKAAKKGLIIDGLPVSDMTKEQLEGHLTRIRDELEREREERNFYQLERDKVKNYWDLVKQELEDTKMLISTKDREILNLEEEHEAQMKLHMQKGKYLQFEHQKIITEQHVEGMTTKKINEQNRVETNSMISDIRDLDIKMKEQERSYQDAINQLKFKKNEDLNLLQKDYLNKIQDVEKKYEQRLISVKDELNLQRRAEIHELEERKNNQIEDLVKSHEKSFADIKQYYTDIILNNLALINTLKEDLDNMKSKEERTDKKMTEVINENKRLAEPLRKAQEELKYLRRQMLLYERDKIHLSSAKTSIEGLTKALDKLKYESVVMQQHFEQVEKERNALYFRFENAVQNIKESSQVKNYILERKVTYLKKNLKIEEKDVMDFRDKTIPQLHPSSDEKIEDILHQKNRTIQDLEYELARVCKTHNDMKRNFESKLRKMGLLGPDENLLQMDLQIQGQQLGSGPNTIEPPTYEVS